MVLEPGTFRVRGDILEIFPIYDEHPLRVEFFGDEIEKIYTFDVLTGYKITELDSYSIYPAKHFVTNEHNLKSSKKNIAPGLKKILWKEFFYFT